MAVGTRRVTGTDPGPEPTRAGQIVSWAGLLLLMATAVGLLGQGAYNGPVQRFLGLLVAAATLLTLVAWPPTGDDVRALPLLPVAALAAWAVLDAILLGQPASGAAGMALLLAGVVAVLFVGRRLGPEDRELLLLGLTGVGLVVALTGWLGVTQRVGKGIAAGSGSRRFGCNDSGQDVVVRVNVSPSGKAFMRGRAVIDAESFACGDVFCGDETDSETVQLRR